jgi:uncharacterized protein
MSSRSGAWMRSSAATKLQWLGWRPRIDLRAGLQIVGTGPFISGAIEPRSATVRHSVLLLIALAGIGAVLLLADRIVTPGAQKMLPAIQVTVGDRAILAELATTPSQQQAGLSGRASLEDGKGMLFVLDPPKRDGFWMKGMRFPLDIIYGDADGVVMTIHRDVPPESYPRTYYPIAPAKYVLEVPGGFVTAHHIGVGDMIVVAKPP